MTQIVTAGLALKSHHKRYHFFWILPLALVMTFASFQAMRMLIAQDYVEPEAVKVYDLPHLRPEIIETQLRPTPIKPVRLKDVLAPPPPPKFRLSKADLNVPAPTLVKAPASQLPPTDPVSMMVGPVQIPARDLEPIIPPAPVYPDRGLIESREADCDVRFDVDSRGRPFNVAADCSDPLFVRSAVKAMRRVEFAPRIEGGEAVARRNVVYPLEYRLPD